MLNRTVRNRLNVENVRLDFWIRVLGKGTAAFFMVVVWLPMIIGLTFEVTLLRPVALLFDQSSIFQVYRCFVFGALIVKILLTFCIVALGENNGWKQALEQVYANGFRNMNLTFIWKSLVWPISAPLLFYLAFPYFLVRTWNLVTLEETSNADAFFRAHIAEALAHVIFLGSLLSIVGLLASLGYFKHLHDQIRDELFLVGKRLVNYDPNRVVTPPVAADIDPEIPVPVIPVQ